MPLLVFSPQTMPKLIAGTKGFNQMRLNALYNLLNRTYVDAIIQPARQENENKAMCDMIERYPGDSKTLFIADKQFI